MCMRSCTRVCVCVIHCFYGGPAQTAVSEIMFHGLLGMCRTVNFGLKDCAAALNELGVMVGQCKSPHLGLHTLMRHTKAPKDT